MPSPMQKLPHECDTQFGHRETASDSFIVHVDPVLLPALGTLPPLLGWFSERIFFVGLGRQFDDGGGLPASRCLLCSWLSFAVDADMDASDVVGIGADCCRKVSW